MLPFSMPLGRCVVPELRDELCCLAEPLEGEQMQRARGDFQGRQRGIVRAAHGDRSMRAIREPDDEIRISTAPDADDLDLLAAERVMGMGDGHASQRRLGIRGSVL